MPRFYGQSVSHVHNPSVFFDDMRHDKHGHFYLLNWDHGKVLTAEQIASYIPTTAHVKSKALRFVDFFQIEGLITCTEEFRQKVEELEPGVHQFFPITVYLKDGSVLDRPVYIMNICVMLDSIVPEMSSYSGYNEKNDYYRVISSSQIALDKNIIKNHYIWTEKRILGQLRVFSDELCRFIDQQKMRGMDKECDAIIV